MYTRNNHVRYVVHINDIEHMEATDTLKRFNILSTMYCDTGLQSGSKRTSIYSHARDSYNVTTV